MPDELEINGVNGAIVPIADRDRSENTNRGRHEQEAANYRHSFGVQLYSI